MISVIVPTVTGRESYLERAVKAYEAYADVEVLVYRDLPGCGPAWADGAEKAKGDYIHFGADDWEVHPGWWRQAVRLCDLGFLPAPRVLNSDGSLQSCGDWNVELRDGAIPEFTRGPFVSRAQWEKLEPLVAPFLETAHYYTDNIFTWAGRRLGMETVVCRSYECTHHMAPQKRGAGMTWEQRMQHDHRLFLDYIKQF